MAPSPVIATLFIIGTQVTQGTEYPDLFIEVITNQAHNGDVFYTDQIIASGFFMAKGFP